MLSHPLFYISCFFIFFVMISATTTDATPEMNFESITVPISSGHSAEVYARWLPKIYAAEQANAEFMMIPRLSISLIEANAVALVTSVERS